MAKEVASSRRCIYLDNNGTSPIYREVAEEMQPFLFDHFGNPSSSHAYGRVPKQALDLARERVANLLGAKASQVYFTGSGTESNNWAIRGALEYGSQKRPKRSDFLPHVVTSNIEHPAVAEALAKYKREGLCDYTEVAVDTKSGVLSVEAVEAAFRTGETVLCTVMHSNNEIGSLQPIAEIAKIAHAHGALMHTDGAQSVGKVDVDVEALGVDLCTVVGHKFGASKGVAALYCSLDSREFPSLLHGGGQENGMRPGTENVLLISGIGKASEIALLEGKEIRRNMLKTRNLLRGRLVEALGSHGIDYRINGPAEEANSLPNTLSISIPAVQAQEILADLSESVAASAGAACHSGGFHVSGVLKAIGLDDAHARGTLRLSTGRLTTEEEIERASDLIVEAVLRATSSSG
ncbi:cysteine desulfurase [Chloropicon primus]|uniref:Cysteine desulfurase n=1 Tax=Chloropicon primus TaxID=1764295 RepID=A0A5B8MPI0_9CHLO|nr:cysteine desulfurase [Chloropicon primus]UPR01610.1 cysteine desulfurase [Chloropicon primus]|eukprot:QDZ22393.1 cysteine desulfurase [Chloropicon primus]